MATTTASAKIYRQFHVITSAAQFIIRESGETTRHPINWTGEVTREGAWAAATSQAVLEIAVLATGQPTKTYAASEVFNPVNFEDAAYSGYVGYGLSMTDGHYAPIGREIWIRAFRKEVLAAADQILTDAAHGVELAVSKVWYSNDASRAVKSSLAVYAARLVAATAK